MAKLSTTPLGKGPLAGSAAITVLPNGQGVITVVARKATITCVVKGGPNHAA